MKHDDFKLIGNRPHIGLSYGADSVLGFVQLFMFRIEETGSLNFCNNTQRDLHQA